MNLAAALAGSYLIGAIPTAYLVVRWLKRIDVRTVGSGNVGATNVTRAAGLWAGLAVFCIDLSKGLVAVLVLAPWLLRPLSSSAQLACGLCAVTGHVFSVFLKFSGGKGVATTIGVLVGTMPMVAGICLMVWGICFAVWRYVSVGSMAAIAVLPILQAATGQTAAQIVLGTALALLVIVKHRSNLERLRQGREHRISW